MARTIQIRHVPDDLHRRLRERAAEQGMSLSDLLLHELLGFAARPPMRDTMDRMSARPRRVLPEPAADAIAAGRRERRASPAGPSR